MGSTTADRRPGEALDHFWRQLKAAPEALLLLDYDGTLAPFRVERDEAKPYPGVEERLARILASGRTRLVIVSGRPAEDVAALLGLHPTPEVWGMHGFERRRADGMVVREALPRESGKVLEEARRLGAEILAAERIEVKHAAIAFHWRGLATDTIEAARGALERCLGRLTADSPFELHAFDGGLEVRPRGIDKGRAVIQLVEEMGKAAAVAYLGDDLTDEDAFRALGDAGLTVLVRSEPRPTAARIRLEPPGELLRFFDCWADLRKEEVNG